MLEEASFDSVQSYKDVSFDPTSQASNLHAVLHLPEYVKNCGPAWVYWHFTMEQHCGNIVSRLKGYCGQIHRRRRRRYSRQSLTSLLSPLPLTLQFTDCALDAMPKSSLALDPRGLIATEFRTYSKVEEAVSGL
ncbi:hypothetical protein V1505DRAFT_377995 [Lipomyces doorenjongii]